MKTWKAQIDWPGGSNQTDAGLLRLAPTGKIAGKIKSTSTTVTDFSNTSEYFPGSSYVAMTGQDGTYTISNVPVGDFELRAYYVDLGDCQLPDPDDPLPTAP